MYTTDAYRYALPSPQSASSPRALSPSRYALPSSQNASSPRALSPGLQRVIHALAAQEASLDRPPSPSTVAARRGAKQQAVSDLAYVRCLQGIEAVANEGEYIDVLANKSQYDFIQAEKDKQKAKITYTKQLQSMLDKQIDEHHRHLTEEKANRQAAVANCIVPEPQDLSLLKLTRKHRYANDLRQQKDLDANRRAHVKQSNLEEEREYIEHLALELDLQSSMERATHLEKQRTLLDAWERDGHIKNLRKLQTCGHATIKDYMSSNMYDVPTVLTHTGVNANSIGSNSVSGGTNIFNKSMATLGVGYDPRRAKF